MPFLCGEAWTGTSRSYHSPSFYSIDWNRPDDYGHPLLAAAPGVVTRVVPDGSTGYGRYAIIDHGAGRSTLYAHMKETWLVEGMTIDQSQPVGFLGDTGNVTGPHLHFEERLNGTDVPPYFHRTTFKMNTTQTSTSCPDTPVSGDWNGDGKTDLGVFHRTATGSSFRKLVGTTTSTLTFGTGWDRVFVGDWNADGKADVGVRPPGSTKFVQRLSTGALVKTDYGSKQALPLAGDWDGDGTGQLGVWRPDIHRFAMRSAEGVLDVRVLRPRRRPAAGRRLERRRQGRPRRLPPLHRRASCCARSPPTAPSRPRPSRSARPGTCRSSATGTATGSTTSVCGRRRRPCSRCATSPGARPLAATKTVAYGAKRG